MIRTLATAFAVPLFFTCHLSAQEQATSRSVTGQQQAAGTEVTINQIDTSAYPKVSIFATIAKDGVPLKGLGADDFRVREDEVDQSPLTVVPKLTPLTAVVALDTSGSMKPRMTVAQAAAKSFIDMLNPEDKVQVLSFAREVKILSPGGDRASAKAVIDTTIARGDTALYDALYTSVEMLKSTPGRKVVTLLSDGADDNGAGKQLSKHSVDDVLVLAREVNVPIYTVGVGTEIDEMTLRKVANETGGASLITPQPEQLKALYAKIGEQLAGQYNIYYTSNLPSDGSEHRVQLKYGDAIGTKEHQVPLLMAQATTPTAAPAEKVDILTPEYAELIMAPHEQWERLLTGGDSITQPWNSEKAVFGFKGEKTATFDTVRIFIGETSDDNIKSLELLVSNDSPTGPFKSVGTFEPLNIRMHKTGGWQEFKFAPVTAKYLICKMTTYDTAQVRIPKVGNAHKGLEILGKVNPF
jgi:Ca-activated chloride channel family protein